MKTIASFLRKTLILQVRIAPAASSTAQCLHFHLHSDPFRARQKNILSLCLTSSTHMNFLRKMLYQFPNTSALNPRKNSIHSSPFSKAKASPKPKSQKSSKRSPISLDAISTKSFSPNSNFSTPRTDVARVVASNAALLSRSLANYIIPSFDVFKDFFQSDGMAMEVVKRYPLIFQWEIHASVVPNIKAMQEFGVPKSNIAAMLSKPRAFVMKPNLFREMVEKVKQMGFHPSKVEFVLAVHAVTAMTKSTWGKKVGVGPRKIFG